MRLVNPWNMSAVRQPMRLLDRSLEVWKDKWTCWLFFLTQENSSQSQIVISRPFRYPCCFCDIRSSITYPAYRWNRARTPYRQWWIVAKYIYSVTILKYNFEILVLFFWTFLYFHSTTFWILLYWFYYIYLITLVTSNFVDWCCIRAKLAHV